MRKYAPGGSECVLTFKPVPLLMRLALMKLRPCILELVLCVVDFQVDETLGCSLALCFSFWFGVCGVCVFLVAVSLLRFVRLTSSMSHHCLTCFCMPYVHLVS